MNREQILNRLTEARKSRNLTQKQTAEALGISDKTYSKWETGETEPNLEQLCRLMEFYGLSPAAFFSDDVPDDVSPIRAEMRCLTPVQSLLRTRMLIDEAYDGQCDGAIELNKRMIDGDEEAERAWLEPVPAEPIPDDIVNGFIANDTGFLLRVWDEEINLRLLMLPAKAGHACLFEDSDALKELSDLLKHAKLLLPLADAELNRNFDALFSVEYLAEQAGMTVEEAETALKSMRYWGVYSPITAENAAGKRTLYSCANTNLMRAILALARIMMRDMYDRRNALSKGV